LQLLDRLDPERAMVESFVQRVFFQSYRAQLSTFYPLLLAIRSGEPLSGYAAVAGIRPAGGEPLFLEHYLDRPVEQVLGVDRNRVIEIGNLAPASAGQARWLITTLSAFILGAGFSHVVFTGVPKLRNAFGRMGLPLTELAEAHGDDLPPEERARWGTYYDQHPRVFAGDLRLGEGPLSAIAESDPSLWGLCRHATLLGKAFCCGCDRH